MARRITLSTLVLLLCSPALSHAGMSVGLGIEHFSGKEHNDNNSRVSTLNGPRLALSFSLTQEPSQAAGVVLWGYHGKVYGGQLNLEDEQNGVNYDASTSGTTHEGRANFRYEFLGGNIDYFIGLGWDRRNQSRTLPLGGRHKDQFKSVFASIGFDYFQPNRAGFHGGVNIKQSLWARESLNLNQVGYRNNPIVKLNNTLNFSAELGYRLDDLRWDIVGYYESLHYPRSAGLDLIDQAGNATVLYRNDLKWSTLGVKAVYTLQ